MIQKNKYWIVLFLVTVVLIILLNYFIQYQVINFFWGWKGLVPSFFVSTVLSKIIIDIANKSGEAKEQIFITTVYMGIKTISHLAIVLFYFWQTRGFSVQFIISFFTLFILFTTLDLYFLLAKRD